MTDFHQSVLLQEAVEYLNVKAGHQYIDATIGGGGHTFEILKRGGRVLGIDRDPEAIEHLKKKFHIGKDLVLVNANFNKIGEIARAYGFDKVSGILFDLGVSSHQLESRERGFSFQKEGPLDMRMDRETAVLAADIINNFDKRRLHEIFKTYGQEKLSWPIADAICSACQVKRIETTTNLATLVGEVYRKKGIKTKLHPATKVFLALRIVVNSELLNLQSTLPQTVELLKKGGRLVVISFHSLEDRLVKRFFKQEKKLYGLTARPIGPEPRELLNNPRARSAKLRAAERT